MREGNFFSERPREQGLALILVIFIIALAGALVMSMAQSTYISMRLNRASEQRVQAEYLLKSAVNFARILIKDDATPNDDEPQDLWYQFLNGQIVPGELLGLTVPNIRIHLEISPENSRISLRATYRTSGSPDNDTRDLLAQLFLNLGFDQDTQETDQTGLFPGTHFTSKQLVANLIDFQDPDKVSYPDQNFSQGLEDKLPEGREFKNAPLDSLDELASIPGFTPARVQRIMPFVSAATHTKISINTARTEIIDALIPSVAGAGQTADQFRKGGEGNSGSSSSNSGPFNSSNLQSQLDSLYPSLSTTEQARLRRLVVAGRADAWFQIVAKVEYANASFFARSLVARSTVNRLPQYQNFELF